MKSILKKTVGLILAITLFFSMMPWEEVYAAATEAETYTLKNNYIEAVVSAKNGGFLIRTAEGNKLTKDDNNKNLLYHNGRYDTSFTSFKVDYGTEVREYIFGGNYGFLGLSSTDVKVTQDTSGITALWSVDDLTFTQRIELSALNSNENGMASISYNVKNNGNKPIESVKVRVLLDTCLGERDYGYYQVPVDGVGKLETVQKEKVFDYGPQDFVPATLYATDDSMVPTMTAYTVNSTSPYRIAFGHWNNLASSLFEFAPDTAMEFTNAFNDTYLTADSAYALYYDLKDIAVAAEKNISTYYGVYANHTVAAANKVAVNVTSPNSLQLSQDKKSYIPSDLALGNANIGIEAKINNFIKEIETKYTQLSVAIYTPNGVTPMDEGGNPLGRTYSYTDPYMITLNKVEAGQIRTTTFQLKADVDSAASYRKIEIRVFDTSGQAMLTEQNLLGSASFYVLCPGGDGELPKVTFTGGDPNILYYEGTRHFFVTGGNFSLLEDKSNYLLYVESLTDKSRKYLVEPDNITFPENPEGNILDIVLKETIPVGDYQLVFNWADSAVKKGIVAEADKVMTAPALKVVMSDNPEYKNDTYGVLIVYQKANTAGHTSEYEIKSFRNESDFQSFKTNTANYAEILLILKGAFQVDTKDTAGKPVSWTASVGKASLVNGKVNQNTIVTLNNCIDFENGNITLHYGGNDLESGSILLDFDGELYTSDARTGIWKGKAALTEITDKTDFSLVPYNEDGTIRSNFADETITLLWPSALSLAQTITGMVFNMTYGKLGAMYDDNTSNPQELGRVIAFSANMDLSFLVPSGASSQGCDTKWNRIKDAFNMNNDYYGLRTRYERFVEEPSKKEQEDMEEGSGQASVMVDNILYGCGVGFVGFRFEADLKLPAYTESMPTMKCKLKINTIGDWGFEVAGSCKFTTIEVEVEIGIKSRNNIPVPDKLYFFISGFEPGINVDGSGVLWITGGGGGIDNLDVTIFSGSKIPPLKIMLSVSFDIIKVLSGRVDMSLGLRGLSLSASDIKIKFTDIMVLQKAGLQFDWYPDWYFQASIKMSLLGVINGAGYIVVIDDAQYDKFFEFFVRAGISVPKYIPIVGGFEVGGVDLGVNKEKLWGVARIIGIKFGIIYYWDGDFDWGTGAGSTSPTFPGLLGYESVPVYYDKDTGHTLRMVIGTNLNVLAVSEAGEDVDSKVRLLGAGATLSSSADRKTHMLNLGDFTPSGEIFTMTYTADSLEDARTKAAAMSIKSGAEDYGIVLGTNANVTYDPEKGKGTFAISATEADQFNKIWYINTIVPVDIVLYGVSPMPEITRVSQVPSGSAVNVSWTGSGTDKLDRLDFYLTTDPGTGEEIKDMGTLIGSLSNAEIKAAAGSNADFNLPGTLKTGDYYIKAVYIKEGAVNGSITSSSTAHYENSNQPAAPTGITVENGGDSTLKVSVGNNENTDYDAYLLNVYEEKDGVWVISDVNGLIHKKQEQVDANGNGTGIMLPVSEMSIGGSYSGFDQSGKSAVYGLTGGKSYKVGVTAVKNITGPSQEYSVLSSETLSPEIVLATPTPPSVIIQNTSAFTSIERTQWGEGGSLVKNHFDTSKTQDVVFTAESDALVTGHWDIDGDYSSNFETASSGLSGSFADVSSVDIELKGLTDGDHTLTVWGNDEHGDSFRVQKVFCIDTQPPKLLISAPVNGGYYAEDGTLQISGVTDKDALFSIILDGKKAKPEHRDKTIIELGGTIGTDGVFSLNLGLDPGKASHKVLMLAEDKAGNFMQHEVVVKSRGLADIESLDLYMSDGLSAPVCYSNNNLPLDSTNGTIAQFSLIVNTKSGRKLIVDDASLVDWNALAVKGAASVDSNGLLTAGAGSMGYVTGGLKVAARGSMTAAATFGAENYSDRYSVIIGATIGGTVTGAGYYKLGDTVTLQATPLPGYIFKGWIAKGTSLTGDGMTATLIMPDSDVTVTAEFEHISASDPYKDSNDDNGTDTRHYLVNELPSAVTAEKIYAAVGELKEMVLPELPKGENPDFYMPYYINADGEEVIVPFSITEGGKVIFMAPANAIYYIKKTHCSFSDIKGHWAEKEMLYAGARGIFKGVGNEKFDPKGKLNRAMLVVILHRLAGAPVVAGNGFSDVAGDTWYTDAVLWASRNELVKGYSDGSFGPQSEITREQLATILYRYMSMLGKDPMLTENCPALWIQTKFLHGQKTP